MCVGLVDIDVSTGDDKEGDYDEDDLSAGSERGGSLQQSWSWYHYSNH